MPEISDMISDMLVAIVDTPLTTIAVGAALLAYCAYQIFREWVYQMVIRSAWHTARSH